MAPAELIKFSFITTLHRKNQT